MSLKLVTLIAHDGKTLIKVYPLRVNRLAYHRHRFTKIHFGLGQAMHVTGELETVEKALSAV